MYELEKGIFITNILPLDNDVTHILNLTTNNLITHTISIVNLPLKYDYNDVENIYQKIVKCMNIIDKWVKNKDYTILIYTEEDTYITPILILFAWNILNTHSEFRMLWKKLSIHTQLFNKVREHVSLIRYSIFKKIFYIYLDTVEKRVHLWKLRKYPTECLDLSYLNFTEFPTLPENIYGILIEKTPLKTFKNIPITIKKLLISNKELESLDFLPDTLEYLILNTTTHICRLPYKLKYLEISNSNIEILDTLPPFLRKLELSENYFLKTISAFPNTLRSFCSFDCPLSSIPRLPDSLTYFRTVFGDYSSIPYFPPHLHNFSIQHNKTISNIPSIFPNSIIKLIIENTPNLNLSTCTFPKNVKILRICTKKFLEI
jgi:hypothetical protein